MEKQRDNSANSGFDDINSASKNTKEKTIKGLFWEYLEKLGGQLVAIVVSIFLARLLGPNAYGIIPLITVFTGILAVIVQSGFASSLIQRKGATTADFSTVFYFQLALSVVLFIGMFFAAPYISGFYNIMEMTPMVRILSLSLIIGAVNNVQHAYVSKTMQFKRFFFSSFTGTVLSGIVGIAMAFIITAITDDMMLGAWALVAQKLTDQLVDTVFLWFTVKWRPTKEFSFKRLKSLYSYGWKILVSEFIDTVYNDLRTMIIGKMYSSADLAYYNKGSNYPKMLMNSLNAAIQGVLFPALSSHQDNIAKVKSMTRRALKTSSFIVFPAMMILAVSSDSLIGLLLGDRWGAVVPFMWIACFTFALWPVHTTNLQAIQALGRSDIFLRTEVTKKVTNIILLGISIAIAILFNLSNTNPDLFSSVPGAAAATGFSDYNLGVLAIAVSGIVATIACSFINAFPNSKLMGYTIGEQIKDIAPAFGLSALMGAAVYCVSFLPFSAILGNGELKCAVELIVQAVFGVIVYILMSKLFRVESLKYIVLTGKEFIAKKKKKGKPGAESDSLSDETDSAGK